MKIEDLQNGQVVRLRTGRAGRDRVEWGEWRNAPLYVQRNLKCKVVIIAIKGENWAEYSPQDYSYGVFTAEDYYMEIEGLE